MAKDKNSQKIIIDQFSQDLEDLGNYLKDLWQFLPLPIFYTNPLFIILDANLALENFFGLKAIELIGEKVETFFRDKTIIEKILDELSREKKIKNKEAEMVIKTGKRTVSLSASVRQDAEKNLIGYYFSFFDITASRELQAELEKRAEERTKELQEKVEELERFQKIAVGREIKMAELKEEIQKLKEELEKGKERQ